jgi:hypothetical protein
LILKIKWHYLEHFNYLAPVSILARSVSNALEEAAVSMTNRVESLSKSSGATGSNASRQQQADPELLDIRQQLQYLKNELKSQVCF